jgi:hypothetical protein
MIEVRSYRRVFDLERRLYRIDRLRLNPGGVPVMGVVYFLAILATCLAAGSLPVLGEPATALPWYLRDLVLPAASAAVLSVIRIEGRPFHLAAHALIRYRARPRYITGACGRASAEGRWAPEEILLLPDGSDARMRRLRYTGPGAVLVAVEHDRAGRAIERGAAGLARRGRRPTVIVRAGPGARALPRSQVILLERGVRLLARGRPEPVGPKVSA